MNTNRADELVDTIRRQLTAFSELSLVLEEEHRALVSRDPSALSQIAGKRTSLLSQIENFDKTMAALLQALRAPASRAGIESLLETLAPTNRTRATRDFAALREIAEKCRDQNEVNGRIIAQSQRTTQQLLRILRGNIASNPDTYSSSGNVDPASPPSTLATA